MTTSPQPLLSLEQILAEAEDLAILPQVVLRVIDLTVDPKATAADVERVVGMDQALAGRILALANSSYYGLPRQVSSVREAVVFLGFKSIRNLAMAVTSFNMFLGKSDSDSLVRRELWKHAMDTAQAARLISTMLHNADRESFSGDEAFTCGLMHDIGKLVLDKSRHSLYVALVDMANKRGQRFCELESQALSWTHAQLGMAMAARWNLPRTVCETIGFHHTPRAAQSSPQLTATVALANELTHFLTDRMEDGDTPEQRWQASLAQCEEMMIVLRLTPEKVQTMANACQTEIAKGFAGSMSA
jgi:HD-like signal output (HDOD) protein